jgi:thiol-disulfide isomerase/thioredoxin
MSSRIVFAAAAVILTAAVASPQKTPDASAKKPTLAVGSPAPQLDIEKWVKGSPIAGFEKGKVYVVEFWATWCGPCIAGMPHLSELQRQYKDRGVTVIGVTSKDTRGNDLTAVETMVKDKGDVMDYTVAWDSERKTSEAYMKAAGRNGIPCSFLVDGKGQIAYIGHPMFLDLPMEQVVAGTWDIEKGNAAVADAQAKLGEIRKAIAQDPKSAAGKISEFEGRFPAFAGMVGSMKFDALLAVGDFPAAYAAGGKLVDEAIKHKNSAELNEIAWKIVDPEATWATRDLDLAMRAATQGVAFAPEKQKAPVLDTLARVHFLKGDVKSAIEIQTKAVEASTGQMKEALEQVLAEYKAKGAQ